MIKVFHHYESGKEIYINEEIIWVNPSTYHPYESSVLNPSIPVTMIKTKSGTTFIIKENAEEVAKVLWGETINNKSEDKKTFITESEVKKEIKEKLVGEFSEHFKVLPNENYVNCIFKAIIVLMNPLRNPPSYIDESYLILYHWGFLPLLTHMIENHMDHGDILIEMEK